VNHRCQQEQEHALSHENAAGIEDQPDLVELCHVNVPSLPAEPGQFDVRQDMSNDGDSREDRQPAHINRVQFLRLLVSETRERQVRFISHDFSPKN
jgi:hypothetical protein